MATYTVTGHPLNYNDIGVSGPIADLIRTVLQNTGVGQTITITLPGPDDTKAKAHGLVK